MNEPQKGAGAASQPLVFQPPSMNFEAYVKTLWRGEARLWVSFWILGIAILTLTSAVGYFLYLVGTPIDRSYFIVQVLTVPSYLLWGVSVWRSAFKSSHWIWAIVARFYAVMAVLLGLAALVNLVFNGGAV